MYIGEREGNHSPRIYRKTVYSTCRPLLGKRKCQLLCSTISSIFGPEKSFLKISRSPCGDSMDQGGEPGQRFTKQMYLKMDSTPTPINPEVTCSLLNISFCSALLISEKYFLKDRPLF
ncbi:hypothetical protein KIL84_019356 [Mauremys mutica]|uniref:Uncharacterized protein n=1 Tax=Mauremys mutica TaxID=74926 RepID=A0A9D3XV54_9SAUR|nr:hypothetical protein KIL84_019356 [Mauremys mutica]